MTTPPPLQQEQRTSAQSPADFLPTVMFYMRPLSLSPYHLPAKGDFFLRLVCLLYLMFITDYITILKIYIYIFLNCNRIISLIK